MDNLQPRQCLKCGKSLSGRMDKRFCDAYCRNAYNNQAKRKDEVFISDVNKAIRRNRRILKTLSPQGKAVVRKTILEDLGYDFNHFSGLHHSNQSVYYLNYDYGFRALMDNGKQKVQIIQIQQYMNNYDPWSYVRK